MSFKHMQVRFMEPQEWWQQGYDRPPTGMYAIVNTSDKYTHPRYCPVPAPRIVSDPFFNSDDAQRVLASWIDDWEFEDHALSIERGDDE